MVGVITGSSTGGGNVTVQAQSTGGTGGGTFDGPNGGIGQAGNGGVASLGGVTGYSTTGNVAVTAILTGGGGGIGSNYASGGIGADASLNNAVSGSTSGNLTLTQWAIGGAGGSGGGIIGYGTPGTAGNATSTLTINQVGAKNVIGYSAANSGAGGDAGGGASGTANATIDLTANGNLDAEAYANDFGSEGASPGGYTYSVSGGAGGPAMAIANGTGSSTISGQSKVRVIADAIGDAGGSPYSNLGTVGSAGAGGTATASATGSNAGPDMVTVEAIAAGGSSAGGSIISNGGNASATASGVSYGSAQVSVTSWAVGGSGNTGGSATAIVSISGFTVEQDSPASGIQGGSAYLSASGNFSNGELILAGPRSVSLTNINLTTGTSLVVHADNSNHALILVSSGGITVATDSQINLTNHDMIITGAATSAALFNSVMVAPVQITNPANGLPLWMTTAVIDGLTYQNLTGNTLFDGVGFGTGDLLLRYGMAGDITGSGHINVDDYLALDRGYAEHLTGYVNGDINHDGVVNAADYAMMDLNYLDQGNTTEAAGMMADHAAEFGGGYAAALDGLLGSPESPQAVPEPASLMVLGMGAVGMLGRNRNRRTASGGERK